MKSVKRVLKRSFQPRYNLRSRKTANTSTITSTPKVPKVDTSVQANLSEEENCELLHELPFRPRIGQVPPRQANIQNSNKPFAEESGSIPTAHTSPDTANRTNCEAIDISIDQNDTKASIFQANSEYKQLPRSPCKATESSSLEDFSPIDSRRLLSGPRIALEVEQISETSDKAPHSPKQGQESADVINSPSINSPAVIHNQVTDRINYRKPKQTKKILRSESISSYESETTETDSEREEDSEGNESYTEAIIQEKQLKRYSTMEPAEITELQRQVMDVQRQMCKQLKDTQTVMQNVVIPEPTVVKPTLFHGYENENVDRWLQRFTLYLANRKIRQDSNQAAIQLALHLSGPAESFYYNLPSPVQSSFQDLQNALKERFTLAHRSLRLRQALSIRRQGPSESVENFLADLNEKFSCLDLRDEDKLSYLVQGLRPDIQAEVLKKEPKTYADAEDTARLIYSIQQSLFHRREEDISRIVLNEKLANASTNTTVQPSSTEEDKKILNAVKEILQRKTEKDEATVLANLETLIYGGNRNPNEQTPSLLTKLDELLEKATRGVDDGPSQGGNTATLAAYAEHSKRETQDLRSEIRRMEGKFQELSRRVDARINGLNRKNFPNRDKPRRPRTREEQCSQRTRIRRPICYKCGRVGHMQYNCYNYNRSGNLYQNQEENTNSLETDQEANAPRPNKEVTNDQQPRICPNHERSYNRKRRELRQTVQQSNILLLQNRDANLNSSDLTTEGKIANQSVQLLVDTGACVSAIDKQFFTKIYGQFPPQLSDGSLTSVQTVSGDTVPVLGKITVPLQLNGREYPCEFHVMQNLAYDAILGRDFLQENGALIDLVDNTLSFKGATHPGKQSTNTTTVSVMGTFLPQPQNLKEKKTETSQAEPVPLPKLAKRRQKNKGLLFQQPLLVLMFIIVYLLTASCTPHMKDSAKPVIQKMPKFFVQGTPNFKIEDGQVIDIAVRQANCKEKDQSVPNEREAERINIPKSKYAAETWKSDYSSQITVGQKFIQQEDEKKDFLDAINAHLRDKVPRY